MADRLPDSPVDPRDVSVETQADVIARLIRDGQLIPVQVFGSCGHPVTFDTGVTDTCEQDEHWSYGLSDRFSTHAIAGSDCNRADYFLLRPSDDLIRAEGPVRAALTHVLAEGEAFYDD